MSVQTRADDLLDGAVDDIDRAIAKLGLNNPDTWGVADYTQEFRERLIKSYTKLCKIRLKLRS